MPIDRAHASHERTETNAGAASEPPACRPRQTDDAAGGATLDAALGLARALAPLWVCHYRFRLRPATALALPLFGRGAILRGGFGLVFRRLVCHDLSLLCRACPLRPTCPYPEIFESAPPAGGDRLSNFLDIPRPFAFDPPEDPRATFVPGDTLCFDLTLAGRANAHLPYFITAFRNLADTGLGPRRARFAVESVEALGAQGEAHSVYLPKRATVHTQAPRLRAADLVRQGDLTRTSLRLRFLTPLDLKDRDRRVEQPLFGPLLRRLRDRAAALAAFFGDGPLALDFRGLGDRAETVRLVEDRTRRVDVRRESKRTGARHDIGGLVGEARYEGEALGGLMPLLRLGERIHVGRHSAFGNGRIEVAE